VLCLQNAIFLVSCMAVRVTHSKISVVNKLLVLIFIAVYLSWILIQWWCILLTVSQ